MKKALYPILFFVLLLIAAFFADSYMGKKYAANAAINSNWVWSLKDKNLDYVAMGSSRVKSGFDAGKVNSLLNTSGLNIGEHGIGIAEQYLLTARFLQHNTTKYLFLQVDHASQNSDDYTYPFHEYNYFPYFGDTLVDKVVKDKAVPFKYYFWRYIPMFKYAEFNSEYVKEDFVTNTPIKRDAKGFMPIAKTEPTGVVNPFDASKDKKHKAVDKQHFGSFNYHKEDSVYLHKILALAASKGVKVVMYTSPEWAAKDKDYAEKVVPSMVNYYKAIAVKYNVPYFNFFNSAFSADRANISGDGLHLTYKSINVFTPMFADSLKKYMK